MTPAGVGLLPGSRFLSLRSSLGGRRIAILAGAVAAFSAVATVGDLLSPVLLERCPLALVALNPRTGHLIALALEAPLPVFLVASFARLCAADPLYFLLGRALGPALTSAGRQVRGLRRLADRVPSRSGWLWLVAVAASPTAKTMLFAGGGGLPAVGVAAANVTGTLGRVLLVWWVGRRSRTWVRPSPHWPPGSPCRLACWPSHSPRSAAWCPEVSSRPGGNAGLGRADPGLPGSDAPDSDARIVEDQPGPVVDQ